MRKNSLVAALVGVLFACGLVTAGMSSRYFFCLKRLQEIRAQALLVNNVRGAALALANDAMEYSKRNAAILPLLQQYQVVPRPAQTPAAAPVTPKLPAK